MLASIAKIKNLAVFQDFDWDRSVKDSDNTPLRFKKLNVIFGRNYSGKTTLSRILRSLETGTISDKYGAPEYAIALQDGSTIVHTSVTNHPLVVRVFNEDFVRENLAVFHNEDDNIAAFAVLGEDNADVVDALSKKERELGSEGTPGSLHAAVAMRQKAMLSARSAHERAQHSLENLLIGKAKEIKNNTTRYEDVNYTIRKIRPDIEKVLADTYVCPTKADVLAHEQVLNERSKPEIPETTPPALAWDTLLAQATDLLGRTIKPTVPLQTLLDDVLLQEWVRQGKMLHEGKRITCGFCGNALPADLWDRLDKHFSEESEALRVALQNLMKSIDEEISKASSLLQFDSKSFYDAFADQVEDLKKNARAFIADYVRSLKRLRESAEQRLASIFSPIPLPDISAPQSSHNEICKAYETLRSKNNAFTKSLSKRQSTSRRVLRQAEVSSFLATIDYVNKQKEVNRLENAMKAKEGEFADAKQAVADAERVIAELRSKLRDERNGAEKVNQYLNHDFGHRSLRLEAIPADDDTEGQYRFEIRRDAKIAHHLSEGERSLIAFCYFLARLDDTDTSGKPLIVWIDDPASNLDDNHAFFVYSLIRTHIAESPRCQQLIISTHNLSFLKYLYRLPPAKEKQRCFLLVERKGNSSSIVAMPEYLKHYVTEFHHLFQQIYRCATADLSAITDANDFYHFPNNVRRFLEMYLVFKYPDQGEGHTDKIRRFFGQDAVTATVADRVNNEILHVLGLFERVSLPMDPP
ncbi:MAG: AAA family ATPase [Phycisphaerales bacterium]|nr:AAA family ATPase [Phycisphaerales bacterium]